MTGQYHTPDIYIEEVPSGARPIQAVGTSTAGFVGLAPDPKADSTKAHVIDSWSQFMRDFCANVTEDVQNPETLSTPLSQAVWGFFQNGGSRCYVVNVGRDSAGKPNALSGGVGPRRGLDILTEIDDISIVAAPGFSDPVSHTLLTSHCENQKTRVAILDPPGGVTNLQRLTQIETAQASKPPRRPTDGGAAGGDATPTPAPDTGLLPAQTDNGFAAFYFPYITIADPFNLKVLVNVPPSGHIAGVWARNDATRGVHKAPANEAIIGAVNVEYNVTRTEQGVLNDNGVNCIRLFPREGIRIWGARTRAAALGPWSYLNVRRLFIMIEESIARSTRWVVFEPNDLTLWKAIRRDISAFLRTLWQDGALIGATPQEAFFVKCDADTNPAETRDVGQVITLIGLAPVKPAEFVIFRISQRIGGGVDE